MDKIKLTSYLTVNGIKETNVNNEYIGNMKKNILTYNEGQTEVKIKLNKNSLSMCRKTDEYEITMDFDLDKKTSGNYNIYKIGNVDLNIKTSFLNIEEGNIELSYVLDINNNHDKYNFILKFEVI